MQWAAVLAVVFTFADPGTAHSQAPDTEDLVELNFSGPMDLPKLVQVLEEQLPYKYVFAVDNPNRQINVVTPAAIPRSALKPFLDTLLRSNNLAVVDSAVPGWKRIVDFQQLKQHAPIGDAKEVLQAEGPASVVTQIFRIQHTDAAGIETLLRNPQQTVLSKAGGVIRVGQTGTLIVTDYASNVKVLADLLEVIDQPTGEAKIDFYPVKNRTPAALIEQAQSLLGEEKQGTSANIGDVKLFPDPSGKRVIIAGQASAVINAQELLQQLDTGADFYCPILPGAEHPGDSIRSGGERSGERGRGGNID